MKHTIRQLLDIALGYYPPEGAPATAEGGASPEERRRVEAHARACAKFKDWVAMLQRLGARFPGYQINNRSLFRQSPDTSVYDLSYSGSLDLPARTPEESYRYIGFLASIVVPYYVIYDLARLAHGDQYWQIGFDFAESDLPFVQEIGRELESTFPGYSPMPEEIGKTVVPGVHTSVRRPGEATLYDCLFSDDW